MLCALHVSDGIIQPREVTRRLVLFYIIVVDVNMAPLLTLSAAEARTLYAHPRRKVAEGDLGFATLAPQGGPTELKMPHMAPKGASSTVCGVVRDNIL
jgi:hypothetical protein